MAEKGIEGPPVNLRLCLARLYLPAGPRRRKLEELLRLTARAFGEAPPSVEGLSLEGLRRRYAEFSREMADRALARPEGLTMIERRLFDEADRLGHEIAKELGVSTLPEVLTAARILYRGLGIDFRGDRQGDIVIRRCSFSRHYSPDVCRLMSSLDAGLLSGLAGGGELEFTGRLTEGASCCRARFSFPEAD
ncbi:MAG: hypothetical protein H6P95_1441 [Candidatus Aminicenantes bacterium]|nr:hypothetical protein [Candidatus Aminicenantes bacterium]